MMKSFLKDVVKYLPSRVVPGIVGFISIPIITRLFSPEDYGNYSLVMATVMILVTLSGWIPMSIVRFYPGYERDKKLGIFYGNIVKSTIVSIVVIIVVFYILISLTKNNLSSNLFLLMYIGGGLFFVTAIFDVLQYFLRSKRQVGWYSGFVVWKSIVGFLLGLLFIFTFKSGIKGLLWGVILGIAVILPFLWKKAIGNISIFKSKADTASIKEMIWYSFPLVVSNLSAWILSLSDRYILEFFRGSQEVGIYSASYNISDRSIMLLITLFMWASGPILMNIWEKEGEAKSKEFISKITRLYLIVCIPFVTGVSVLAKPIMAILTGQQYLEGYMIIPFVMVGVLFLGLQQMFQSGFLFYKKTGFITIAIVISGLLNCGLNIWTIPKYGYIAAAGTTFISYAFLLLVMMIGSRKSFVWQFPMRSLITSVCASLGMGVVVYFVGMRLTSNIFVNLVLSFLIGIVIYSILLLLFNEFRGEEKEILKNIFIKYLKKSEG